MSMLKIVQQVPEGFLDAEATAMLELLGGPTLMHLPGKHEPPLFVSVLLHGDELAGLHAVQTLLREYQGRELPRALSIFVGNVEAAEHGVRRLAGQPDYNRIWPGTALEQTPEHHLMQRVVDEMAARKVFASIDIHNNTGINPHYACVNSIDHRFFHLATLFSRTVVYFTRPQGVQSQALARLCPAVTVECGQVGQPFGDVHALEYLEACMHLSEIPDHPVATRDMDLFHTVANVKVPHEVSISFDEEDQEAMILFEPNLDYQNFRELAAGTLIGRVRDKGRACLEVWDNEGNNVHEQYVHCNNGEIRLLRPVMPSMFTRNERAIRQDCLGYLMERYQLPEN